MGVDAAVVVCEADPNKVLTLSPLLQFLDTWEIPHLIFINKMDRPNGTFAEVLAALKNRLFPPGGAAAIPHSSGSGSGGFH